MRPALVTGGAGFIGSNLADRLLAMGRPVIVLDNLSRPGVERNARWLVARHGDRVEIVRGDTRDADAVRAQVARAELVYHFAAQVAVTTSLFDPRLDFTTNALGTLNVLEAARAQPRPPTVVYTSTNKVYGALPDVSLAELSTRWEPSDPELAAHGVSEARPLDFHSPYGCSKGAADQYVIDYGRSFGLPTVVFRMSCIYGPRQLGTEDQGWVAHFLRQGLAGAPLTVYGDGKQVRDLLFIDDLVEALVLAGERIARVAGRAFNLGGGPDRTLSLVELLDVMGRIQRRRPEVKHEGWRTGDQRWFVADTRRFEEATGWRARVEVSEGLERLQGWLGALADEEG